MTLMPLRSKPTPAPVSAPPRVARVPAPPVPDGLTAALVAALRPMVEEVVRDLLVEFADGAPAPPELLTTEQICAALGCSRTSLHRLVLDGLPRLMLLDSPRYRLSDCVAWLETRTRERQEAAE
jgi:hypothetical protein